VNISSITDTLTNLVNIFVPLELYGLTFGDHAELVTTSIEVKSYRLLPEFLFGFRLDLSGGVLMLPPTTEIYED